MYIYERNYNKVLIIKMGCVEIKPERKTVRVYFSLNLAEGVCMIAKLMKVYLY
jgi:hypothetical protein